METYAATLLPETEVLVTVELSGVCILGAKYHDAGLLSTRV